MIQKEKKKVKTKKEMRGWRWSQLFHRRSINFLSVESQSCPNLSINLLIEQVFIFHRKKSFVHGKTLESLANNDGFFWRYLAMWWYVFSSENTLGSSWNLGSTKSVTNTLYEETVGMWRSIQKRDMQALLSWQSVMTNLKRKSVNTSNLFSRW